MSIGKICTRDVYTARETETAKKIATRMVENNVGSVIVVDDNNAPMGMITDRDLMVKVVAKGLAPYDITANELYSEELEVVNEDASIEDALRLMRAGPYRRLPVVGRSGGLVGLVALDDVLVYLAEEFRSIGGTLLGQSKTPHETSMYL